MRQDVAKFALIQLAGHLHGHDNITVQQYQYAGSCHTLCFVVEGQQKKISIDDHGQVIGGYNGELCL